VKPITTSSSILTARSNEKWPVEDAIRKIDDMKVAAILAAKKVFALPDTI